jgi:hypothetical protein
VATFFTLLISLTLLDDRPRLMALVAVLVDATVSDFGLEGAVAVGVGVRHFGVMCDVLCVEETVRK